MQGTIQRSPLKLRSLADNCTPTRVREELNRARRYQYNLGTGDTFAAILLTHSTELHTLIFGYHHIIMDGVSWQILQRNSAYYSGNSMAQMIAELLSTQYIDFTKKQQLHPI